MKRSQINLYDAARILKIPVGVVAAAFSQATGRRYHFTKIRAVPSSFVHQRICASMKGSDQHVAFRELGKVRRHEDAARCIKHKKHVVRKSMRACSKDRPYASKPQLQLPKPLDDEQLHQWELRERAKRRSVDCLERSDAHEYETLALDPRCAFQVVRK
jgi:hypothetical protein